MGMSDEEPTRKDM